MSDRSKPRGGRKSRRSPSSETPPASRANGGGNGDGRRAAAGEGGGPPSNGSANGSAEREKRLLERAGRKARSAPEVREELVARYRKLIADGRYHPDPEAVAERMIRKGLLRDI